MATDTDGPTEAEPIATGRGVVERLRLPRQVRAHRRMPEFRTGDGSPSGRTGPASRKAC